MRPRRFRSSRVRTLLCVAALFSGSVRAQVLCPGPEAPHSPWPPDASSVDLDVGLRLRWNVAARARRKAIYGTDDRRDIYEVTNPDHVALWESTVALANDADLVDNGDGTFTLESPIYGETFNLCPEERFVDQPDPAWCSGFLVAEDIVATAGHCILGSDDCAEVVFVFGFRMLDASTPVLTFEAGQIYHCSEILARRDEDGTDWGLIRLDRPVPDHVPLHLRREGMVSLDEALVVIGHPGGLPAKISDGGHVRDNSPAATFVANLDTFVGNSGSAVINASTLVVEGILVRGDDDFVPSGPCYISKRCPDDGCLGEEATRTTEFASLVPAHPDTISYELWFGPCGAMERVAATTSPEWSAPDLDPQTEYCWRVITRSECGDAPGPVWSFVTAGGIFFRRGDSNVDGEVDISDAVATLAALFLGEGVLVCDDAADSNDDGLTDISDPVHTLSYLFLGIGAIPPPGPRLCGPDPGLDLIDCAAYPASCD